MSAKKKTAAPRHNDAARRKKFLVETLEHVDGKVEELRRRIALLVNAAAHSHVDRAWQSQLDVNHCLHEISVNVLSARSVLAGGSS